MFTPYNLFRVVVFGLCAVSLACNGWYSSTFADTSFIVAIAVVLSVSFDCFKMYVLILIARCNWPLRTCLGVALIGLTGLSLLSAYELFSSMRFNTSNQSLATAQTIDGLTHDLASARKARDGLGPVEDAAILQTQLTKLTLARVKHGGKWQPIMEATVSCTRQVRRTRSRCSRILDLTAKLHRARRHRDLTKRIDDLSAKLQRQQSARHETGTLVHLLSKRGLAEPITVTSIIAFVVAFVLELSTVTGPYFLSRPHLLAPPGPGDEHAEEADPLVYLTDCTQARSGSTIPSSQLFQDYCKWAKRHGFKPLSQTAFGRKLTDKLKRKKSNGIHVYLNIALQETPS